MVTELCPHGEVGEREACLPHCAACMPELPLSNFCQIDLENF